MTHTRKRLALLAAVCTAAILTATADSGFDMKPLKLEVPEIKPELVDVRTDKTFSYTAPTAGPDLDFLKSKTNPGTKAYRVMDDLTFVGGPLFVAGWAIKGDKAMFRVNNKNGKKNTQLLTDFKTGIDDYTQFFGPVMTVGLKLGGVEGRSDWPRLMASAAMSYGIMAAFVNGIKYTAKEMRPDGSTANSWPSGHTATSFVGATLLHKEYGLTRSPWYSVAGYGVATATGVMRVLNNRHWVSDVMSGAGIGIMSTELGYALSDILFKGKGLLRNDLELDSDNPSFFSISMGLGIGGKDIDFNILSDLQDKEIHGISEEVADLLKDEEELKVNIDFRAATVVGAEGAYFFNKYVGVGGQFRVRAMSAKTFGQYADISSEDANVLWTEDITDLYKAANFNLTAEEINSGGAPITNLEGIVKSDHLAEFTASLGLYFNLPITSSLSLGSKLLIGRSFTQELDIDGHAEGNVKDINYGMIIEDGQIMDSDDGGKALFLTAPVSTGETFTDDWDFLTLGSRNATSWGTGLSLTYRYKSNFSWKLFVDYDYSKKDFTMTYDPYHYMKKGLTSSAYSLIGNRLLTDADLSTLPNYLTPEVYKKAKKMNYVTLGLSFAVSF
jgi:membrane-associated phospholipid phosphatase